MVTMAEQLASLPGLSKSALCAFWKQVFRAPPPTRLRRGLMIQILAYRIQEQTHGALRAATQLRLRQVARAFEAKSSLTSTILKPGTRLVRQWRDQVHLVNVEADGYEYQGVRYQSLSEIARQITGTRWSGPAFFGIKQQTAQQKGIY